jgi:hypothetical protein
MMFLDCPAWLDADGALRCGLPAEVRRRFLTSSTGGPLESAMIRCPAGHWFNGPIEFLTWESSDKHPRGLAGPLPVPQDILAGLHDGRRNGRGGSTVRNIPADPHTCLSSGPHDRTRGLRDSSDIRSALSMPVCAGPCGLDLGILPRGVGR